MFLVMSLYNMGILTTYCTSTIVDFQCQRVNMFHK
jgi:hypothetical protein